MKLLFICNQNQHRSPTAAHVFKDRFVTSSAGLYNEHPVTVEQIEWAEVIIVMDERQRATLAERFPKQLVHKQLLCLDIPDVFLRNDPKLVSLLTERMKSLEPVMQLA